MNFIFGSPVENWLEVGTDLGHVLSDIEYDGVVSGEFILFSEDGQVADLDVEGFHAVVKGWHPVEAGLLKALVRNAIAHHGIIPVEGGLSTLVKQLAALP